jgi:YVTN family beta-propeller protein
MEWLSELPERFDPTANREIVSGSSPLAKHITGTVAPTLNGEFPLPKGRDAEGVLGEIFNFLLTDPLGGSIFTVTGIDPADGLDATSGTEFVTGLTFVGSGSFTGTMTPITTGPDVYITNAGSKTVSVINPPSDTVVAIVKVGPNPVDAVLTPNGAFAYITNGGAELAMGPKLSITIRIRHGSVGKLGAQRR